jgi:hypothetical protein
MGSEETVSIEEAGGDGRGGGEARALTFDWSRQKASHWRLGIFVFISIGVHGFAFYLFQVVYPQPERFTAVPARVTLLMSDDSAVRGVLRAVEDRVVYFDTGTRETAPESNSQWLTLPYEPSYVGYRPRIRRLPDEDGKGRLGPLEPLELPEGLRGVDGLGPGEGSERGGGDR